MKHRVIAVKALVTCVLLAAGTATAAKWIRPTSDNLRHPLNFVAVAEVSKQVSEQRFTFRKVEMIQGESEGPWQIRMSPEVAARVEVGKSYTIAFSGHVLGNDHPPWIDPEGLRLISDPFAGGEVLLPVVERLSVLLATTDEQRRAEPQKEVENILEIMRVQGATLCRVAVSELALRRELLKKTSRRQKAILRMFITDDSKDALARATMIEAGLPLEGADAAWAVIAARQVVKQASLQVDPDSGIPRLQRSALLVLRQHGSKEDTPLIARLLASSSTGVGTSAMKALKVFGELEAARTVHRLLSDDKVQLPPQSRHDFETFVKRWMVHPSARKQGPGQASTTEQPKDPGNPS